MGIVRELIRQQPKQLKNGEIELVLRVPEIIGSS